MAPTVPDSLRTALVGTTLGDLAAVDAWLAGASDVAERLAGRWGVTLTDVLSGGAMSLCTAGMRDRRPVVLKVPYLPADGVSEATALRAWSGGPVPRLLADDPGAGAVLMERVDGDQGDPSPAVLLDLLDGLAGRRPPPSVPPLSDRVATRLAWARAEMAPGDSRRAGLVDLADQVAVELLEAPGRPEQLLHGDLMGKNLLCTPGRAVALDPLASVGDPAADLGFWAAMRHGDRRTTLDELGVSPGSPEWSWTWVFTVVEDRTDDPSVDSPGRAPLVAEGLHRLAGWSPVPVAQG